MLKTNSSSSVNLNNCDREPIHIPGTVQPHAVFLALREPDLLITQVSDNIAKYFNQSSKALVSKQLNELLGDIQTNVLKNKLLGAEKNSSLKELNPLVCKVDLPSGSQLFDLTLHRTDGFLILEMEPCVPRQEKYINNFFEQSRKAIEKLEEATSSEALFEIIVQEVKKLTGFARVMAYQFDEQGHGSVIAEAKENFLEPFLGLHYPASDIPKQARALYLRNWLRLIPDIDAIPSPLVPELNLITGRKLDLSFAVSRSVSPIHIQYLQNMGVHASMSISLIIDQKLWGLIACHHPVPKFLPYETRNVCDFLGQIFSWKIMQNVTQAHQEMLIQRKDLCNLLLKSMSASQSWIEGLLLQPSFLLKLVNATGAVIYFNEEYHLVGDVPDLDKIKDLLGYLSTDFEGKQIFMESVATIYPHAETIKDKLCGVLLNPIVKENGSFIMWMRPELIKTISWAGDPKKSIVSDESGERLSPRGSFALWKEHVHLCSTPWTEIDQQICNEFKKYVLEIIVTHETKRASLAEHLIQKQENFVDTVCHEIRNPIHGILGSVEIIRGHLQEMQIALKKNSTETVQALLPFLDKQLGSIKEYVANIEECAQHQTVVANDVLNLSKLEAKKLVLQYVPMNLNRLIRASFKMLETKFIDKDIKFIFSNTTQEIYCKNDAQRLRQVMVNLLSNAIKFTQKGSVTITLKCVETKIFASNLHHELMLNKSIRTNKSQEKEEFIDKNFADDQLSLQQLLVIASIEPVDSERVKIIFNELKKARIFVEKLVMVGIEKPLVAQEPRQIDTVLAHNSQIAYAISLSTAELSLLNSNKLEIVKKNSITQFHKSAKISLIQIDFEDTGIGMTLDEMSSLFSRFTQANNTISATYGGSGLGLMISRELMTLMGGSIEVVSQKGHGAKFTLLLPYIALTSEEQLKLMSEENKLASSLELVQPLLLKPKLVLVVEDNVMNQKILINMIGKEHQCLIANNGEEAITLFLEKQFDIIFMDINMTIMDGLVATQKIRQIETEKALLPTIIIGASGNATQKYQESALTAGMDDYITKPYNKENILAIMRKLDDIKQMNTAFSSKKNSTVNATIPLRIYTKTPTHPQLLFRSPSSEYVVLNAHDQIEDQPSAAKKMELD